MPRWAESGLDEDGHEGRNEPLPEAVVQLRAAQEEPVVDRPEQEVAHHLRIEVRPQLPAAQA